MRAFRPAVLYFAAVAALFAFASGALIEGAAAQATAPADAPMKAVSLTQKQVDGLVVAQKQIHDFDAKQPQEQSDKPDPKVDAQLASIVKKNGFTDIDDYAAVSATIGQVMAGIDPDSKTYVGPGAVIKKQIADVQGDAKMPAKEKKETLGELNAALKTASSDKPSTGNIDLVIKNFDALSQAMEAE